MFFETAGIEIAPWIPPLVAFFISFFTSMGGVSGAFLLLPFQMSFLGYTNPSVSATNQLFNIVAIPSGVIRYYQEGRLVWPLTWAVIIGTLPGVFIGAVVRVAYLPDPKNFKLFVALVLLYIGLRLSRDLVRKVPVGSDKTNSEKQFQTLPRHQSQTGDQILTDNSKTLPPVQVTQFNLKHIGYTFHGEQYQASTWGIFMLSFTVGIVGGIYGIGGGAIIAPFFISILRLPVYTVAGAALMGTLVTSVVGVLCYQGLAPFYPALSVAPDWFLGILFGLGGMGGMYLGARCQKYVPAKVIKGLLCLVILFTVINYLASYCGF